MRVRVQLSAPHWNQDEEYGGFGGPHCTVVGGYAQVFTALASLLDVRLSTPAAEVRGSVCGVGWGCGGLPRARDGERAALPCPPRAQVRVKGGRVEVVTAAGEVLACDAGGWVGGRAGGQARDLHARHGVFAYNA